MKSTRWLLYGGVLLVSLVLAFLVRDLARDLLITSLAYLAWQVGLLYWAVPQLVKWAAVVLLLSITVIWQLIPDFGRAEATGLRRRPPARDKSKSWPLWIHRARNSNYFKWQLANRSGSDRWQAAANRRDGEAVRRERIASVEEYLAAGLEHSFVDFPMPRHRFQRRTPTPLDLPPAEVVDYLESQMEIAIGRHDARSLKPAQKVIAEVERAVVGKRSAARNGDGDRAGRRSRAFRGLSRASARR